MTLYRYSPDLLPPPGDPAGQGIWRNRMLLPLDELPIVYPLLVGGAADRPAVVARGAAAAAPVVEGRGVRTNSVQ